MNFYEAREAFLATVAALRHKHFEHNATVSSRQVARARLRGRYFRLIKGGTRRDRWALSRAYAAGEFKSLTCPRVPD